MWRPKPLTGMTACLSVRSDFSSYKQSSSRAFWNAAKKADPITCKGIRAYQGPGGLPNGGAATDAGQGAPVQGDPSWGHVRGPGGPGGGTWDQGLRAGLIGDVALKRGGVDPRKLLLGHLGNLKERAGCVLHASHPKQLGQTNVNTFWGRFHLAIHVALYMRAPRCNVVGQKAIGVHVPKMNHMLEACRAQQVS